MILDPVHCGCDVFDGKPEGWSCGDPQCARITLAAARDLIERAEVSGAAYAELQEGKGPFALPPQTGWRS